MNKTIIGYIAGLLAIPVGGYFLYIGDSTIGIGIFIIGIFQIFMTKYYPNGIFRKDHND